MIEVLEPGALTSVQDAVGRIGFRRFGVPVGGAADAWSARLANRLVGNPDDAALLEITLAGPVLRFEAAALVAVAGATYRATVDGMELPIHAARVVRTGGVLRIGSGEGARAYLAVAGGIVVARVLGSASTDLRSGFGGHEGRALRAADRLGIGVGAPRAYRWTGSLPTGPIRIVPGPHSELVGDVLSARTWTVSTNADRVGVRIDGDAVRPSRAEVPSIGLPLGAIQTPPDGRPIVMLADRPVTGGYPVPACVIGADVGRVAQLRPGDPVRFEAVSVADARAALREREDELAALEAIDAPGDDELTWVGSLD